VIDVVKAVTACTNTTSPIVAILHYFFAPGMNGIAGIEPDKLTENLQPLFQEILKLPKAQVPTLLVIESVNQKYLVTSSDRTFRVLTPHFFPLFSKVDKNHPLQMLIANVDYDDFKGKMGIGRVLNGELNAGDTVAYGKPGEPIKNAKIAELYVFNNVGREKVETASAGTAQRFTVGTFMETKHVNHHRTI
jgi:GTP-binding protein